MPSTTLSSLKKIPQEVLEGGIHRKAPLNVIIIHKFEILRKCVRMPQELEVFHHFIKYEDLASSTAGVGM